MQRVTSKRGIALLRHNANSDVSLLDTLRNGYRDARQHREAERIAALSGGAYYLAADDTLRASPNAPTERRDYARLYALPYRAGRY